MRTLKRQIEYSKRFPNDNSRTKSLLRQQMRARRNTLSTDEHAASSRQICERLHALDFVENVPIIAAYLSTPHEASLDAAIGLWLETKIVVVPSPGLKSRFDVLQSLENVQANARGLRISSAKNRIAAHEPDVILVPGLAFDSQGNRLGQGGGWYDRTMERARKKGQPIVVGVCFETQIVQVVPCETHDARVDWIVSEKQTVRVLESE